MTAGQVTASGNCGAAAKCLAHAFGAPEGEERGGAAKGLQEIMAEHFPKPVKDRKQQILGN